MIHVRVGKNDYPFDNVGLTKEVKGDVMLFNYKQYDTIIINNAHKQANLKAFVSLCKRANIQVFVGGKINDITTSLLDIADTFVKEV